MIVPFYQSQVSHLWESLFVVVVVKGGGGGGSDTWSLSLEQEEWVVGYQKQHYDFLNCIFWRYSKCGGWTSIKA